MQRVGPAWLCVLTGAAGPLGAAPGRGLAGVRLAGGFSAGLTGSWASATFPSMGGSSGACAGSHRTGLRRRSRRPVGRQGVPDAPCERLVTTERVGRVWLREACRWPSDEQTTCRPRRPAAGKGQRAEALAALPVRPS